MDSIYIIPIIPMFLIAVAILTTTILFAVDTFKTYPKVTMTNQEFAKNIRELVGENPEFEPIVYYDKYGDCIELFTKPDSFKAKQVSPLMTVYYSLENNEFVGLQINGIKKMTKQ